MLIHVGFAMSKIDEGEAKAALDVGGEPTPARPTATTSSQRAWLRRTTPSRSGTWPA